MSHHSYLKKTLDNNAVFLRRASWIRDSSFTLYALIRLGFTEEANSNQISYFSFNSHPDKCHFVGYMDFIFERLRNKNQDGSLQIMYTIHG